MDKAHEGKFTRRADFSDLPLPTKLGLLQYEYEHVAVTDEEKAVALAAVERMREVIEKLTPREYVHNPKSGLPYGFSDLDGPMNKMPV